MGTDCITYDCRLNSMSFNPGNADMITISLLESSKVLLFVLCSSYTIQTIDDYLFASFSGRYYIIYLNRAN